MVIIMSPYVRRRSTVKVGYPGWPNDESMELSIYELYSFAKQLFPDNEFVTYVPPSNVLCESSRIWLPQVLPELRVISSVYSKKKMVWPMSRSMKKHQMELLSYRELLLVMTLPII